MNKEQAIGLLEQRKRKLNEPDFDALVWTNSINSDIKKIFSKTGIDKARFMEEILYEVRHFAADEGMQRNQMIRGKAQAGLYIDNFIDEIRQYGLEDIAGANKNESETFASKISAQTELKIWVVTLKGKAWQVYGFIILLFMAFTILIILGVVDFSVKDGKPSFSFGFKNHDKYFVENGSKGIVLSSYPSEDTFCINHKGENRSKKYTIRNLTSLIELELKGQHKDTLVARQRVIYDIYASQDISVADDLLEESYASNSALTIQRWFGNCLEKTLHSSDMSDMSDYFVNFDCKAGECKTIITGASYYFKFPLANDRKFMFRNLKLSSNEDVWIMPSEDDVIGKLTIVITSKDLKFENSHGNALYTYTKDGIKENKDHDAFCFNDGDEQFSDNTLTYTWENILPNQECGIKYSFVDRYGIMKP